MRFRIGVGLRPFTTGALPKAMFKAFIDDSHMGQPPVYILAGWVASATAWAAFSDAWRDVLWMSPRIEYFKYSEAMGLKDQFNGISKEMRDEKIKLLTRIVEEHKLLGISSIIPSRTYDIVRAYVKNPYIHSFFGIVIGLLRQTEEWGIDGKIDFVFDYQPGSGQMKQVEEGGKHSSRLFLQRSD